MVDHSAGQGPSLSSRAGSRIRCEYRTAPTNPHSGRSCRSSVCPRGARATRAPASRIRRQNTSMAARPRHPVGAQPRSAPETRPRVRVRRLHTRLFPRRKDASHGGYPHRGRRALDRAADGFSPIIEAGLTAGFRPREQQMTHFDVVWQHLVSLSGRDLSSAEGQALHLRDFGRVRGAEHHESSAAPFPVRPRLPAVTYAWPRAAPRSAGAVLPVRHPYPPTRGCNRRERPLAPGYRARFRCLRRPFRERRTGDMGRPRGARTISVRVAAAQRSVLPRTVTGPGSACFPLKRCVTSIPAARCWW